MRHFVPFLPMLPNQLLRAHWRRQNRERDTWRMLVTKFPKQSEPPHRARVLIIRHSTHQPDQDNLFASVKWILDSLVERGQLMDDSPEHLELTVQWQRAKRGQGGTTIEVEPLP